MACLCGDIAQTARLFVGYHMSSMVTAIHGRQPTRTAYICMVLPACVRCALLEDIYMARVTTSKPPTIPQCQPLSKYDQTT